MTEQRTLRELSAPDANYNSFCIDYPTVAASFELKSGLIHLLPKFSGFAGEDPHRHLKEFQVVCSTPLRPEGITEDMKEICGIRQADNESLAEYWERFKHLVSSCPQHQITEQLLVQYFYEGLLSMDKNILDAASGGVLVDKIPAAAKALIENMSLNSQQFTSRSNYVAETKGVNEIQASSSNRALESRIDELTSLIKQLALEKTQIERVCGPSLEDFVKQMVAQNTLFQQQMVTHNLQFQQTANACINDLKTQVEQLATTVNLIQNQGSRNLPAQTLPNLNVSAITLRSGKEVDVAVGTSAETSGEKNKKIEKNKPTHVPAPAPTAPTPEPDEAKDQPIPLPFPQRAVKSNQEDQLDKEREILDVLKKIEVNIPLLEAIKQIPRYVKFLKEMCTNKRKLKGNSRVNMSRNVSAIIQQTDLPEKCEDLGVFTVPGTIGNTEFGSCMLDLGSSINVMPTSIYNSLSLGPMQPTGLVIQLENRSITCPKGVVEDVCNIPDFRDINYTHFK
ncbi:hypothetical protein TSUD_367100 [Trifolium subterraneum]|uniref:Retrotransposon gag domain-containing protein n=1 Tax=Trifolium subterraneum TaxID=3900 RepID=A0A2Z6N6N6_TRISU|nr:hypothetical protein TSUD_367100 [Trifolium subterraneum]